MAVLNFIRRWFRVRHVLLLLLLTGGVNALAQSSSSKEYQIKAAFLFNFAQFVDWPTLTNSDTPFQIGVLGENPFGSALEETVQGETIKNHKIAIVQARSVADLKNCQMIFISKSEKKHIPKILSELNSSSILTVSELDGFTEDGGIINFYLDGRKVRFEINPTAARREGLKISSQLLSLGKIVEPAEGGER